MKVRHFWIIQVGTGMDSFTAPFRATEKQAEAKVRQKGQGITLYKLVPWVLVRGLRSLAGFVGRKAKAKTDFSDGVASESRRGEQGVLRTHAKAHGAVTDGKSPASSVWKKFDAGKDHRSNFAKSGDCQVRALCVALGITYREAWTLLYRMQGERAACAFELVEELHVRNSVLNVVREISFPAKKGKKRMTATVFCAAYTCGRYILQMPHHVAVVKDGVLLDTWDSSRACVYRAWEIMPRKIDGGVGR